VKRLLIIDAHSIIHRAFYALPPLSAPDGRPIQAVYGLARVLLSFLDRAPDYIIAASDMKGATFRKEVYDDYKANRAETPDDLAVQIDEAKELFERLGIPFFEKQGVEADDIIATIVEKFGTTPDLRTEILSSDSDLFQLVRGDSVVIRTFKKGVGDIIVYDENAIFERYGLAPRQMVDYKALVGDTSDNVKGVPGIGPKTASTLLQLFGSVENLYKNLDKVPKHKEKFEDNRKTLDLGRMLITLKSDVSLPLKSLEELKTQAPNVPSLAAYFNSLGFTSLVRQVENAGKQAGGTGGGLKRIPKTSAAAKKVGIKKAKQSGGLFVKEKSAEEVPATVPTTQEKENEAPIDENLFIVSEESLKKAPKKELESAKVKVGFDIKSNIRVLWENGKDLTPPYADLGIAFWLLQPDMRNYDPEIIFGAILKKPYHGSAANLAYAYSESQKRLVKSGMQHIFDDIEMPLIRTLAEMEQWGIYISDKKLQVLDKEMRAAVDGLTRQIYKLAGTEFNLNSPKQVGEVLFDKLKIQDTAAGGVKKKTTASRSTRFDILDELRDVHPIIPLFLKYREDFKLLSTYVTPLLELRGEDGILHTEYLQTGTATGRIASRAPNLQNIPQESSWSKPLRSAFEARKGHTFVSFDYSQLELRIMAGLTGDLEMKKAFAEGEDIHRRTASVVLGKTAAEVTHEERRIAKTLNFGLAYGMGVRAFAKASGLKQKEAQSFIDTYFKRFSRIRTWQEETKQFARQNGYTETMAGRRRYFTELQAGDARSYLVAEAERQAINHPLQGLAADIVKKAMIQVKDLLVERGAWGRDAKMLLNIHDELLFEVRDDMVNTFASPIASVMENVFPELPVPLRIDVNTGKDWGAMSKMVS